MTSIMPNGTSYFEVEELYIFPKYRGNGVGKRLFKYAEIALKSEAEYLLLSMAPRNFKPLLSFYLDELGMEFWNARLFKRIGGEA